MRTLSLLFVAFFLFVSVSPSALAVKRTDSAPEVIPDHCAGKTGKDRGRCISDTLNDLARQQKAFAEKQRTEREAWLDEHASMGITSEYLTMKQAFIKLQMEQRKAFEAEQLAIRKKLHDEQAQFRKTVKSSSSSSSSSSSGTAVSGEQTEAAKVKCAKITDDRAKRMCLKRALNILAPESKPFFNRR